MHPLNRIFPHLKDPPDWEEILRYFRGSELQNYFTRILEDNLQSVTKPQFVDSLPKAVKGTVGGILDSKAELENKETMIKMLDLKDVLDRDINNLSGGELQVREKERDMFMVGGPTHDYLITINIPLTKKKAFCYCCGFCG
jgi:translation initiation factor RLI1